MLALCLAIAALLAPALVAGPLMRRPGVGAALDGFVLVAIAWLVLTDVAPEAVERGGWLAALAFVLGVAGPTLAERLGFTGHAVHRAGVVVGQLALMVHAGLDGVALAAAGAGEGAFALAGAVVLHQIPVGLAVWGNAQARLGRSAALLALLVMAAVTAGGWYGGAAAFDAARASLADARLLPIAEALSAGTLLHVVAHAPLPGAYAHPRLAGLGGVAAIVMLLVAEGLRAAAGDVHGHEHPARHPMLSGMIEVGARVGPGAVVGAVVAAGIAVWRPASRVALEAVPAGLVVGAYTALGPGAAGSCAAFLLAVGALRARSGGARLEGGAVPAGRTPAAEIAAWIDRDAAGIVAGWLAGAAVSAFGGARDAWFVVGIAALLAAPLPPVGRLLLAAGLVNAATSFHADVGAVAAVIAVLAVGGRVEGPTGVVTALRFVVGGLTLAAVSTLWSDTPRAEPAAATTSGVAGVVALAALLILSLLRRGPRGWLVGATDGHPLTHDAPRDPGPGEAHSHHH
jgi:hypothetical protein